MVPLLFWGALAAAFVSAYARKIDWEIGWVHDVNPDGMHKRRAMGINGQFPAQPISVNSNEFVGLKVTNKFYDGRGTTIHGHGLMQNNTNYYDGAPGLTQCSIMPNHSFWYEILNSAQKPKDAMDQWGTFWLHSHNASQYVDGLRAPFIIHNANGEVYDYDDEYTVVLTDWYHAEADDLGRRYLVPPPHAIVMPTPDSGLMYFAHTKANATAKNLPGFNDDAKITFRPGKKYRLRILNASATSMFNFWIEGHDMKIIEADGVDTEAHPVDVLQISTAQRYSVLVEARNDTKNNWKIHANMDPSMFESKKEHLKLNLTSTITYGNDNAPFGKGRQTLESYEEMFDETVLKPIIKKPMVESDISYNLVASLPKYTDGLSRGAFNNITYLPAKTPSMLTMMTEPNANKANAATYGPNSGALVLPHLQMVEITIVNDSGDKHPFHFHGTQFQIVHKAKKMNSASKLKNPPFKENQENPIRRDTVAIAGYGSATLRFRADNPGVWFMHCHMDWHLVKGFAMIVVQAPLVAAERFKVPDYVGQQCRMQGLPSSGNAGGIHDSTINFGNLTVGPEVASSKTK